MSSKVKEPAWLNHVMAQSDEPQAQDALSSTEMGTVSLAQIAAVAALARWDGEPLRVLDLTVGSGHMLGTLLNSILEVGDQTEATALDISEPVVDAARTTFRGMGNVIVRQADALRSEVVPSGTEDLVLVEPPLGMWDAVEDLIARHPEWYPYGGSPGDTQWMFVQRALRAIKPAEEGGGRVVAVVSSTPLMSGHSAAARARQEVMEADLLEAIVRLPGGLAAFTETPLYVLVFSNKKVRSCVGRVRVVDLQPHFGDEGDRRKVSESGLRTLWMALATKVEGPYNRSLPQGYFHENEFSAAAGDGSSGWQWKTWGPTAGGSEALVRRYGHVGISAQTTGRSRSRWDLRRVFDYAEPSVLIPGSTLTRLSALLAAPPSVNQGQEQGDSVLWLPTGQGDASLEGPADRRRVLYLSVNPKVASAPYLAGWLNTSEGKAARSRALHLAARGATVNAVRSDQNSLNSFVDELVVALPALERQYEIGQALMELRRAENHVETARRQLLSGLQHPKEVVRRVQPWLEDSFEAWARDLPYPFASALWTLESREADGDRHRQIFLTWEAYAAFLAIVLLSVVRADPELRRVHFPELETTLRKHGLSLSRPSIGAWNVVIQRLGKVLRDLAAGTADEAARAKRLFGGADPEVLRVLLSPEIVALLTDFGAKRNRWQGHTGATTSRELQVQLGELRSSLERLKELVGGGWAHIPLVRAGKARRKGGVLHQSVELVMGMAVPFRPIEMKTGSVMDEGELYLAAPGCERPVSLSHLLVLRGAPASERYTAYFFNRQEADNQARLVTYQLSEASSLVEPLTGLDLGLPELLG